MLARAAAERVCISVGVQQRGSGQPDQRPGGGACVLARAAAGVCISVGVQQRGSGMRTHGLDNLTSDPEVGHVC